MQTNLAVLDTAADDGADTLDVVHGADGDAQRLVHGAGGDGHVLVQRVVEGLDVDALLVLDVALHVRALPPGHLLALLDQVVADPACESTAIAMTHNKDHNEQTHGELRPK